MNRSLGYAVIATVGAFAASAGAVYAESRPAATTAHKAVRVSGRTCTCGFEPIIGGGVSSLWQTKAQSSTVLQQQSLSGLVIIPKTPFPPVTWDLAQDCVLAIFASGFSFEQTSFRLGRIGVQEFESRQRAVGEGPVGLGRMHEALKRLQPNLRGADPLNQAHGWALSNRRPYKARPPFYYDIWAISDDEALLLILTADRMSVWHHSFSEAPTSAPAGRRLTAESGWYRVATFSVAFDEPFTVACMDDVLYLLTAAGKGYSVVGVSVGEEGAAATEPILDRPRVLQGDTDKLFGVPSSSITVRELGHWPELKYTLVDRDRKKVYWLGDSTMVDPSEPSRVRSFTRATGLADDVPEVFAPALGALSAIDSTPPQE